MKLKNFFKSSVVCFSNKHICENYKHIKIMHMNCIALDHRAGNIDPRTGKYFGLIERIKAVFNE